jgi:CPA1 family monovalent cation:H+ antiporter
MDIIELTLALIFVVALLGAAARRVPVPLPILLILAGVALSFEPHMATFRLHPDIFFLLFIPPLLFAEGWQFPKREFAVFRYSILMLAFGLVFATTLVVGYMVHWLIPAIPLAAGFALGAVVSPTDAVAVAEVTRKMKLPSRMVAVLNGESLINDASGLVAFKFAVAAVVTGVFSAADAAVEFLLISGGGTLVGLGVAFVIQWLRLQLQRRGMEDSAVQIALSLLTPFAAYLAAEEMGASGILSVVAAGIYAGIDDNKHLTLETRLKAWSVWEMVLFLFNGLVFVLLGLQVQDVIAGISGYSWSVIVVDALIVSGTVVLVRMIWIFPGSRVSLWLNRLHYPNLTPPRQRDVFVAGWAGIRGAVTLAAALSLPLMAGDAPFPERALLIFLATSVIIFTLAVNGLTLPLLIRYLRVTDDDAIEREERNARVAIATAAVDLLRDQLRYQDDVADREFTQSLIGEYQRRIEHAGETFASDSGSTRRMAAERAMRLFALGAERARLHELRDAHTINEHVLFAIQRELDFREASLAMMTTRRPENKG